MSDYVKAKVIRLPLKLVMEKIGVNDPWDCEEYLKQCLGDSFGGELPHFEIECTDESYYLDYVLSSTYGEESGDYGFSFYLNKEDLKKYKPLFEQVIADFKDEDLRKVVYCYYNCCECPDYYKVSQDVFDEL